jgi:tetratricopeptide (TPR) repeat protein
VEAKKDRLNRVQFRQKAYEYLYLANKMDPNHPSTLVLLANHDFHSWRSIILEPKGYLLSPNKLLVPFKGYNEVFEIGNQIKIKLSGGTTPETMHIIADRKEITDLDAYQREFEYEIPNVADFNSVKHFELVLDPPVKSGGFPIAMSNIEVKNLKSVVELATKAMYCTNINAVKAECYYILGKVQHLHKNLTQAFELYGKALQSLPDMAPAAFGAAQIYFMKQDYTNALKLFSDLLQGNQDDKDTQAYVKLLKSIINEEIAPFEKLREITPGFQYEIDLWVIQGQLRHKKSLTSLNINDLTESLKCYLHAKECYDAQLMKLPVNVLSNISNLYYLIGNYEKSIDYLKILFEQYHQEHNMQSPVVLPADASLKLSQLYTHSEFENIFYVWKDKNSVASLLQDKNEPNKFHLYRPSEESEINPTYAINLQEVLQIGDEIMIENMIWIVESIPSEHEFYARTNYTSNYVYSIPLHKIREMKKQFSKAKETDKSFVIPSLAEMMEILSNEVHPLSLHVKEKWNTFNDQTLTFVYNFARILEDQGSINSATLLYQLILALHSSHADCKRHFSLSNDFCFWLISCFTRLHTFKSYCQRIRKDS